MAKSPNFRSCGVHTMPFYATVSYHVFDAKRKTSYISKKSRDFIYILINFLLFSFVHFFLNVFRNEIVFFYYFFKSTKALIKLSTAIFRLFIYQEKVLFDQRFPGCQKCLAVGLQFVICILQF